MALIPFKIRHNRAYRRGMTGRGSQTYDKYHLPLKQLKSSLKNISIKRENNMQDTKGLIDLLVSLQTFQGDRLEGVEELIASSKRAGIKSGLALQLLEQRLIIAKSIAELEKTLVKVDELMGGLEDAE